MITRLGTYGKTDASATFERRIYAHYAYITALLEYVSIHADKMRAIVQKADDDTVKAVLSGAEAGTLTNFLDGEYRSRGKIDLLAYRTKDTKGPPEVVPNVDDLTKAVGTRSARVPRAYVLPVLDEVLREQGAEQRPVVYPIFKVRRIVKKD